jgi:hypothetical protein
MKHKFNFKILVPSLDLLCEKDGASEIHYCVLIPDKKKAIFKITPGNIIKANMLSAYDASWTWLPPYKITEDPNNDESVNLAIGGNLSNLNGLPAALTSKRNVNDDNVVLVTSDYKTTTRISVLNKAPFKEINRGGILIP